ncbi:TIGR03943 family putative permease subunit [Paenibacillus flagellatus]|uniref:TIGR03943 family protein n=1 Tax=Paenibacillus flagellatus TaxID=2211139 RepID=A0A2V5K026_9BACL|nr:TIGR03943 family protein [Paenibacillus flagellatus]PYI50803.1 TIGR03943 family protein [Paenibacillus flagellatus]
MSSRFPWIHPSIRALLLFGFAVYIAYLVKTDGILYYISPRMTIYVKLSALGLYAVGAHQLYTAVRAYWGRAESCDCGHDHSHAGPAWKSMLVYGLFAFPLLLGFAMPDTSMGSSLAAKKGMNLNSASTIRTASPQPDVQPQQPAPSGTQPTEPNPTAAERTDAASPPLPAGQNAAADADLDKLFPSDKFTEAFAKHARELYVTDPMVVKEELYMETLTTLDLYAASFAGKKVKLSGFVYRDETMNDKQFVIGRFAVQCCSADAAPFGVLVEFDRANLYATDEWLELTGTIGRTTFNGSELLVVKAEKIARIEPPKEQYVYPNYDFGA